MWGLEPACTPLMVPRRTNAAALDPRSGLGLPPLRTYRSDREPEPGDLAREVEVEPARHPLRERRDDDLVELLGVQGVLRRRRGDHDLRRARRHFARPPALAADRP